MQRTTFAKLTLGILVAVAMAVAALPTPRAGTPDIHRIDGNWSSRSAQSSCPGRESLAIVVSLLGSCPHRRGVSTLPCSRLGIRGEFRGVMPHVLKD